MILTVILIQKLVVKYRVLKFVFFFSIGFPSFSSLFERFSVGVPSCSFIFPTSIVLPCVPIGFSFLFFTFSLSSHWFSLSQISLLQLLLLLLWMTSAMMALKIKSGRRVWGGGRSASPPRPFALLLFVVAVLPLVFVVGVFFEVLHAKIGGCCWLSSYAL